MMVPRLSAFLGRQSATIRRECRAKPPRTITVLPPVRGRPRPTPTFRGEGRAAPQEPHPSSGDTVLAWLTDQIRTLSRVRIDITVRLTLED